MKIKLFILIFMLIIFWACESPMTPDIKKIIIENETNDPPIISLAANLTYDGYLDIHGEIVQIYNGTLRNIGNLTAMNIIFHVPLLDSSGVELDHLTYLFIHEFYDSSRLEPGQSVSLDFHWQINRDIASQIEWNIKGFYMTWDDEK